MSQENDKMDELFRSKLKDFESDPLPSSWDKIAGALENDLKPETSLPKSNHKLWYIGVAASVVLCLSVWVLFMYGNKTASVDTAQVTPSKVDTAQNISIGSNTEKVTVESNNNVANDVVALINYESQNQKKQVKLLDGSTITLNKKSNIALGSDFINDRKLTLNGMAYFEVKSKPNNNPFTITTQFATTTVVGTEFMINASEQQDEIIVGNGVVKISDRKGKSISLTKGQSVSVGNDGLRETKTVLSNNYSSWKTDKLVFDNTQFSEVVTDVQDYYGVKLHIENKEIYNCRFTGEFDKTSLNEMLQVLSVSLNLSYNYKHDQYNVSGSGCSK